MKSHLFFAAAVAAQLAVLSAMGLPHARAVRESTRVTLPVVPVDPEDLFLGQYVQLQYDISRIDLRTIWEGPRPTVAGDIWVQLEPRGPSWVATRARSTRGEPDPGVVWMRGQCARLDGDTASSRFGIEQFYVREGRGPEIEGSMRQHQVLAEFAVAPDGTATLTALILGGKRIE